MRYCSTRVTTVLEMRQLTGNQELKVTQKIGLTEIMEVTLRNKTTQIHELGRLGEIRFIHGLSCSALYRE